MSKVNRPVNYEWLSAVEDRIRDLEKAVFEAHKGKCWKDGMTGVCLLKDEACAICKVEVEAENSTKPYNPFVRPKFPKHEQDDPEW